MPGEEPADPPSVGAVLEGSDAVQVLRRERRPRRRGPQSRAEAMAWGLFSAGGFVAALLLPIHLAILGIAFGAGWLPSGALSYDRIHHLVNNPLTKLYLLAVISLPLFHWAARWRPPATGPRWWGPGWPSGSSSGSDVFGGFSPLSVARALRGGEPLVAPGEERATHHVRRGRRWIASRREPSGPPCSRSWPR
ncbi:MAG: hypothetical protein E6G44_02155 [Actinobacteria bacterium]|nr:MAG: hypothetical protein E6G44_02155 [Actinomycetota bacterium]